jgi:hypothetical protein
MVTSTYPSSLSPFRIQDPFGAGAGAAIDAAWSVAASACSGPGAAQTQPSSSKQFVGETSWANPFEQQLQLQQQQKQKQQQFPDFGLIQSAPHFAPKVQHAPAPAAPAVAEKAAAAAAISGTKHSSPTATAGWRD